MTRKTILFSVILSSASILAGCGADGPPIRPSGVLPAPSVTQTAQ